jgi:hypothetical protein
MVDPLVEEVVDGEKSGLGVNPAAIKVIGRQ